jgi:hypothetical protein
MDFAEFKRMALQLADLENDIAELKTRIDAVTVQKDSDCDCLFLIMPLLLIFLMR